MRTITELKIKWEDSLLFFVGPVASRERKRRRNKKLKHRQTTENHDTHASLIEAPPLVKSGDIVIRLFWPLELNVVALPHAQTHSLQTSDTFLYQFYTSKKTKLTLIHIVYSVKTRIKNPKNP
jgi:hypothetical protein